MDEPCVLRSIQHSIFEPEPTRFDKKSLFKFVRLKTILILVKKISVKMAFSIARLGIRSIVMNLDRQAAVLSKNAQFKVSLYKLLIV